MPMAIDLFSRDFVTAVMLAFIVVMIILTVFLDIGSRRRLIKRAENARERLGAHWGLSQIDNRECAVTYLRNYKRLGTFLRCAAGVINALRVEIGFVPLIKHSNKGITIFGVYAPEPLTAPIGLSRHDAVVNTLCLLFGLPNRAGSKPLFGNYDASGTNADIQRVFTTAIQSRILAFPRFLEQVMIYDQNIVLIWKGIEEDTAIVDQAFQLAASLYELVNQ